MSTIKLDKSLVGACGVFHVAAELTRRGWIAMPTIRNTRGIDIIASQEQGNHVVNSQVKTNGYGVIKYILGKGNETWKGDLDYYVFVTLKSEGDRPDFYILPSRLVADYIKATHSVFVNEKPTRFRKNDTIESIKQRCERTPMRQFPNRDEKMVPQFAEFDLNYYKDNWDILKK